MNPDTMRWLDSRIGRLLCMILSPWARRRAGELPSPRRILFIALSELGALVLTQPALEEARTRFPDAELYFLTRTTGRPVLEAMGLPPERIETIRFGGVRHFLADTLDVLRRCRSIGIDSTVNFEVYARFSIILAVLTGARWRVGYYRFREEGHYLGDLLTHRAVYTPHHHAAASYAGLVAALSEPVGPGPVPRVGLPDPRARRFRFVPRERDLQALRAELAARGIDLSPFRRLILLNANASDLISQRRWPVERYAELARQLLCDPTVTICLTGSEEERPMAVKLAASIGGDRVANLAGTTSIAQLLHLFWLADGFVTNDSGTAHFASATDIPTVVLFGPETPRIFGPLGEHQRAIWLGLGCSPCVSVYNQKRSTCTDCRCMTDISVGRVLRELREAMAGRSRRAAS